MISTMDRHINGDCGGGSCRYCAMDRRWHDEQHIERADAACRICTAGLSGEVGRDVCAFGCGH